MYANQSEQPPIRIAHGSQEPVALKSTRIDIARIESAVARELRAIFDTIEIVKVTVTPDADRDGNEMLRVEIIFNGELRDTDARNIAGASRRIMPAIDSIVEDDDLYPLLSFVSKLDYDRRPKSAAY
jgi:hypothetical protein